MQQGSPEGAGSRAGEAPRWGRGSATALERMKDLERRHNPSPDKRQHREGKQRKE